jgi:hypothetical protein
MDMYAKGTKPEELPDATPAEEAAAETAAPSAEA